MIDPAFWQSENVARLPIEVRYFFIGLFSNADDQGRMKAHPALIRSKLYPYDDIALDEITDWLDRLAAGDFVILYKVDDKEYLQITNWWKYQHPQWAWPSEHPAPDGWLDRLCYRKGNTPIKENWGQDDSDEPDESNDTGVTVGPEWGQSGATVGTAPSISSSISISDSISDPPTEGADAPPRGPVNFEDWLALIENPPKGSNRTAQLATMYGALFPGRDPPSYSYVGSTAKTVGGAGRLAALMWQASAARATGDVMRYCMGIAKGNKTKKRGDPPTAEQVRAGIRRDIERGLVQS